jgi:hypothetical protein
VIEAANKVVKEFERSIVIEVKNLTKETFRFEGLHHSSGEFGLRPPATLRPQEAVVFSSRSTPGVGAVGNLRLVSNDLWLGMSWHNPLVGSNDFRSSENGPRAGEFTTQAIKRSGNHAHFGYVIAYTDINVMRMMYQSAARTLPWSGQARFAQELGRVDAVSLIQSNYGGNLEAIARVGDKLYHYWRQDKPPWSWQKTRVSSTGQIAAGGAGTPALIQSRFGKKGNFELVFSSPDRGLVHMSRNNDA